MVTGVRMSVEGMWCFVSGDVLSAEMNTGGVVILDTQRIYGGDSVMAYIGTYATNGGKVAGEVESFRYNATQEGIDVFGQPLGPVRTTAVALELDDNGLLVGTLTRDGQALPIVLKKLRELP